MFGFDTVIVRERASAGVCKISVHLLSLYSLNRLSFQADFTNMWLAQKKFTECRRSLRKIYFFRLFDNFGLQESLFFGHDSYFGID